MGYRQDLMFFTQGTQSFTDHFSDAATDTGIHFVKNQCRHLRVLAGNHLQSQADTRQLAAGSHFVQRTGRIAFIRRHLELHLLQTMRSRRRRQQDDVKTCAFHGQMLHMLGGLFAQTAGRLMAHGGENVSGFVVFGKIACNRIFQGFQISGRLQVLQALVNFRQLLR